MYFSVCLGNTHHYTLLPLATVLPSCLCKFSISGLGLFLRAKPCLSSCVTQCEVWCLGLCVEAQAQGFFPQQPQKWKTVGWIQSQYHSFFEGLGFIKPFTKVLRAKTPVKYMLLSLFSDDKTCCLFLCTSRGDAGWVKKKFGFLGLRPIMKTVLISPSFKKANSIHYMNFGKYTEIQRRIQFTCNPSIRIPLA